MSSGFSYEELKRITDGQFGTCDVACPRCGPDRQSAVNRRRPVLRVWYNVPDFLTYCCARCGAHGYARADGTRNAAEPKRTEWQPSQSTAPASTAKLDRARWLWSGRKPISSTPAEVYLR